MFQKNRKTISVCEVPTEGTVHVVVET